MWFLAANGHLQLNNRFAAMYPCIPVSGRNDTSERTHINIIMYIRDSLDGWLAHGTYTYKA